MIKKFLILIVGASAACVTALVLLVVPSAGPGVTKANFDRIRIGMTKPQVDEILGPQDEYSANTIHATFSVSSGYNRRYHWQAAEGSRVEVSFHAEVCLGRPNSAPAVVSQKTWHDSEETILDKICRWFGVDRAPAPPVMALPAIPPPPAAAQ